jgi:hypothetical protein
MRKGRIRLQFRQENAQFIQTLVDLAVQLTSRGSFLKFCSFGVKMKTA